MKRQNKVIDVLSFVIFLISPIISGVTGILGIIKNTRYSYITFSLFISYMSFSFIPESIWDKTRHIEFYELVKDYSLNQFLTYNFSESPDFVFRAILYLAGATKNNVHIMIFFVTFITFYLVLKVFEEFRKQFTEPNILFPLLTLLSFSYLDVFSGLRYTLAISLIFYAYYEGLIKKNKNVAVFCLLIGVFTHFSVTLFVAIYFLMPVLIRVDIYKAKVLLVFTMFFLVIPQDLILSLFQLVGLSGVLEYKVNVYLSEDAVAEEINGFAAQFVTYSNVIWIYFTSFVLLIERRQSNEFYKILIWILIFINVFYAFPVVYNRYALFLKFIIVLYVIKARSLRLQLIYFVFFSIIFLNQLVIMRFGFFDIILNPNKWFLFYQLLENHFTSSDIYLNKRTL